MEQRGEGTGFGWFAYAPTSDETYVPAYASEFAVSARSGPAARLELADVGRLLRRGVAGLVGVARAGERPTLSGELRGHLGDDVNGLEAVTDSWAGYEHVNVQLGLDAWLADEHRSAALRGGDRLPAPPGRPLGAA